MEPHTTNCAIDTLPNELLSRILVIYARTAFDDWCYLANSITVFLAGSGRTNTWLGNPFEYIRVITVCHRWRSVALDCGPFWSNIVVRSMSKTSTLLERSKESPLDVFCVMTGDEFEASKKKALALVLNDIHRIRSLRLYFRAADKGSEPASLYQPLRAEMLESLSIRHVGDPHNKPPSKNPVRKVGAQWTAPRLRHYAVHGGNDIPWIPETHLALQFKNTLTQLIWLPSSKSRNLCHSPELLLSILPHLPLLETLQVAVTNRYPVSPIISLSERSRVEAVSLPRLRRVLLEGNIQICMDVLEHVEHPDPLQQLVILAGGSQHTSLLPESVQVTDFLAQAIRDEPRLADSTSYSTSSLRPMRMLSLRADSEDPKVTHIMAWRRIIPPRRFPVNRRLDHAVDEPFFEMDLSLSLPDALPPAHLQTLFKSVVLSTVQVLELRAYVETGPRLASSWENVTSLLKQVHTLEMGTYIDPEMLCHFLVSRNGAGDREVSHNFPLLKTVRLNGMHSADVLLVDDSGGMFQSCGRSVVP